MLPCFRASVRACVRACARCVCACALCVRVRAVCVCVCVLCVCARCALCVHSLSLSLSLCACALGACVRAGVRAGLFVVSCCPSIPSLPFPSLPFTHFCHSFVRSFGRSLARSVGRSVGRSVVVGRTVAQRYATLRCVGWLVATHVLRLLFPPSFLPSFLPACAVRRRSGFVFLCGAGGLSVCHVASPPPNCLFVPPALPPSLAAFEARRFFWLGLPELADVCLGVASDPRVKLTGCAPNRTSCRVRECALFGYLAPMQAPLACQLSNAHCADAWS